MTTLNQVSHTLAPSEKPLYEPAVIIVAPNGSYKNQAQHPAVPITSEELAKTAKACCDAGAVLFHLHIRDQSGRHLLDAEGYKAATAKVRQAIGQNMLIQITTESAQIYKPQEQIAVVRAVKPEAVSVSVRELVPDVSKESDAKDFFHWLYQQGILIQYIVYSPEDIQLYNHCKRTGIIPAESHGMLLFVLGSYKTQTPGVPTNLLAHLQELTPETRFAVCGFGSYEHACTQASIVLGGHARVSFENNLYLKDGLLAPDNAALVKQTVLSIEALGRDLATPEVTRQLFLNTY